MGEGIAVFRVSDLFWNFQEDSVCNAERRVFAMGIISTKNLTKKFGDFTANKEINLDIEAGEIRAIIGENGAGKTTLMNMLYGVLQPTEGQIYFEEKPVTFHTPKDAIACGLGMVHQHFRLSPSLTVYENILLGVEEMKTAKVGNKKIRLPLIDNKAEYRIIDDLIRKYNFNLDPGSKIKDLSVGARQRVEILKMLYRDVKVLVLDEPTAVLIPQEIEELIKEILELKKAGKTIIIITHKLNEVKMCADYISVMRRGELVGTVPNDENATRESLAEMMVGRPVLLRVQKSEKPVDRDKVVYEVNNLSARDGAGREVVKNVSFKIHANEVLGVAGIEGNGQSELMYLLTGLMKSTGGSVKLNGEEILQLHPDELREKGIGIIPEDRYKQGLCLSLPVSTNLITGYHKQKRFCKAGMMNFREIRKNKEELVKKYDIRLSGTDPVVSALSGGNGQKVIVAREFSNDPEVLLASQPTRGIDVGATEFIHQNILKMRDEGKAVFLISSELTEIKSLADRIIVIYDGEIVGEFLEEEVSFHELGLYMSGAKRMERDSEETVDSK